MKIQADNRKLLYAGRIDWTDPKAPVWVFPATSVKIHFTGNLLKIHVKNHRAYWHSSIGIILDGVQTKLFLPEEGEGTLEVPVPGLPHQEHEVLVFKRMDSCHELTILGFEIADGEKLLYPGEHPERKIEVYGDSVSAGEVTEAVEYTGKEDPEHNGEYSNSWYSYAWMTARRLGAQIHDVAQGGIGLLDEKGWFCEPEAVGMESAWDKIHYNPQLGKATPWNFENYTPQVVIVALGQNDSHPVDYMKDDYHGEKAEFWREKYKDFLGKLRNVYPKAQIICMTTVLMHDASWDRAIEQAVEEMHDEKITQYLFTRNGKATPGHPRIPEAEEMADELTAYIETLEIEGWN